MKYQVFSYRSAYEILTHGSNVDVYNEITGICGSIPLPIFPGKSKKQTTLDVVQQTLNSAFRISFCARGWELEPFATPETGVDQLKADFRKRFKSVAPSDPEVSKDREDLTIQVEVEFGNAASIYRNFFKFQLSYAHELADVGVIILPLNKKLADRIDSGVADFEKIRREIASARLSLTVPILAIGIYEDPANIWNLNDTHADLNLWKGMSGHKAGHHGQIAEKLKIALGPALRSQLGI